MKRNEISIDILNYYNLIETREEFLDFMLTITNSHVFLKEFEKKLNKKKQRIPRNVVAFQELFGKQDYCINLSYKNWVWEYDDNLRIYISIRGFCPELREGLSLEKAKEVWLSFYSDLQKRIKENEKIN